MADITSLSEYESLIMDLPFIRPFKGCCSSPLVETVYVEPLAGRNPVEILRTRVVQCPECRTMYVSDWE